MRLLHTSDWHVGRTFHGRDLLVEQEAVLGGLADLVSDEKVDVVAVSGDLFDRAVPNPEAVAVCARVLERVRSAGARVVITPGNHDSAARLGLFGGFAAAGGLHLRTKVAELHQPVLLADAHGPVAVYGIPFLEPDTARHALGVEARGHAAVLTEAMRRVRADLAARGGRSVVLAHAFVTGGEPCESERTIAVGGVQDVPGAVFDGIDYVALGHLHGQQTLAEHLRYSGSPVAYSFSEARHVKSVWLAELDASGLSGVERRLLPVPRELSALSGELEDLVLDPAHTPVEEHFLSVVLTDRVRPLDALRRLQVRFPHAVRVEWRPEGGRDTELRFAERVRGRSDEEIACCFLEDVRGEPPAGRELELLREAISAAAREGDS
ncbi:exonuclease SbcCD subunit D [Actinosynnema sp. NPDC047251]|uniref:Nuclease SbcCD subunit D n=1 Tax=Saccharothrix espanaensis (strain ATCC 51144 / DSM 44229 / JCM 9112 / NBRC 15066 / NRRL 15764) TaxID=1179773 RepID=K0JQY8_SACES|nr:exonuclease SbcCD subunit D [Saccharothrix espanaensis]CCH28146.1 DNA repair exonuclease [Saccharothrix espanaensis DSM 44229]